MPNPHPRRAGSPTARAAGGAPVSLDALAHAVDGGTLHGAAAGVTIRDVTHDSREAGPGVLFACRPGQHADGHDFAEAAVEAGSPALLVERRLPSGVPQLQVGSVATALGRVAAHVHGTPSAQLALCGITGTNGKTTTAYLLTSVLAAAGHVTGLIGTIETRIAGTVVPGVRTTPEATDLQRLFRRMVGEGVTGAAMEVSSHGLALGRLTGTRFRVALFTNLSQDHLDFHRDLEDYFAAKATLFTPEYTPVAVVNVDDPYGRRLASQPRVEVIPVSPSGGHSAAAWATDIDARVDGAVFTARLGARAVRVRTRLLGPFNVANVLGALAAADVLGIDPETAGEGIAALPGVPGRMEPVEVGQRFTVLVDYSHKPGALEHVLRAARSMTAGRVVVVVGCGGDRDHGKRPLMGKVAAELADLAVLTSDNPRSEDPLTILDAMTVGARTVADGRWTVEPDRRAAIGAALSAAEAGDVVVVAGKGHETYQELATGTVPFDDRQVVRDWLAGTPHDGREVP